MADEVTSAEGDRAGDERKVASADDVTQGSKENEGVRARKRRETRLRIAEQGLRMFSEHGYDETTLAAVAHAAGVSARTLYLYFATKYDILMFWHDEGFTSDIAPTLLRQDRSRGPLAAARSCLLELVKRYEYDNLVIADRVWNSTEALLAQKQLIFLEIESALLAALAQAWPDLAEGEMLRVTAMQAVGAQRLAMEVGRRPGEGRPLHVRLQAIFDIEDQQR